MLIHHVFDKSVKVLIRKKICYLSTDYINDCFFAYFFFNTPPTENGRVI